MGKRKHDLLPYARASITVRPGAFAGVVELPLPEPPVDPDALSMLRFAMLTSYTLARNWMARTEALRRIVLTTGSFDDALSAAEAEKIAKGHLFDAAAFAKDVLEFERTVAESAR